MCMDNDEILFAHDFALCVVVLWYAEQQKIANKPTVARKRFASQNGQSSLSPSAGTRARNKGRMKPKACGPCYKKKAACDGQVSSLNVLSCASQRSRAHMVFIVFAGTSVPVPVAPGWGVRLHAKIALLRTFARSA